MEVDLKSKYLGSMIGSALGDAIGELAFTYPGREHLYERIDRLEKLVYTDDTAMMLGLAASLLEKKGVDQEHLGETFSRNFFREPWRGYALGPPKIFSSEQWLVPFQGPTWVLKLSPTLGSINLKTMPP